MTTECIALFFLLTCCLGVGKCDVVALCERWSRRGRAIADKTLHCGDLLFTEVCFVQESGSSRVTTEKNLHCQ